MSFQLSDLAKKFSLELKGQATAKINRVASLQEAGQGDISFCTGKRHLAELKETSATAVILHPELSAIYTGNALLTEEPHLAFTKIAQLLHPVSHRPAGIHASAVIHETATVHESVSIAEFVSIGKLAKIDAGCEIGAGCYIGEGVIIKEGTVVRSNASLHHDTHIGKNCILYSGCVIGTAGFGHAREGDHWLAVPQLGKVIIGNDVSVGANTTIDRGALGDTLIGNGVKLDNQVHIAHNVTVGDFTAIAAGVGIAGSTTIGKRCTFAGHVGVVDNISICDDAHFAGQSAVRSSITQPGVYASGVLLEDVRSWTKNAMRFKKLNTLFKQVSKLTKKQP